MFRRLLFFTGFRHTRYIWPNDEPKLFSKQGAKKFVTLIVQSNTPLHQLLKELYQYSNLPMHNINGYGWSHFQ
jgi:hypothetical protein